MWDQKLFELFTTLIPQCFAFLLLFFSLTNIKIEAKSYIIFSIGIAIFTFFIRQYVNFGVHSIIMSFLFILIAVLWAKVKIIPSIIYAFITYAAAYVCEWIVFIFLGLIKFDMTLLSSDPTIRSIIGIIPIALLFAIAFTAFYIKQNIKRKEENKNADI